MSGFCILHTIPASSRSTLGLGLGAGCWVLAVQQGTGGWLGGWLGEVCRRVWPLSPTRRPEKHTLRSLLGCDPVHRRPRSVSVMGTTRVRGAFGSSAHAGDSFGTLPAYVIGNSGQIAVQHDFTVDTVPQTNQMLLAMSDRVCRSSHTVQSGVACPSPHSSAGQVAHAKHFPLGLPPSHHDPVMRPQSQQGLCKLLSLPPCICPPNGAPSRRSVGATLGNAVAAQKR
jgi:hypothetical protein